MSTPISSERLWKFVAEALRIDRANVVAVTIELRAHKPALVSVESFADQGQGEGLATVLKRYELVERAEEP